MASVRVKVTRPLWYLGERRERDEVLRVEPADAWMLCSSGRAELEDAERDGAAVVAAVQAETKAALAQERKSARYGDADPRWIPRF